MQTGRRDAPLLVQTLNEGPGTPEADVEHAAIRFQVTERTIYRRIHRHGIRRVYTWELPEGEAA
jgi:hypothetical protein